MAEVKIINGDRLVHLLRTLPSELTADRKGGPVLKSLRKGANLIRKEMRKNLQQVIQSRGDESTGLLMKNLKVRRKRYRGKGERMTVGVGNKRYPKKDEFVMGRNNKLKPATMAGAKTTRLSGQRLEYGTSKQTAMPWVRPAFNKTAETAILVITTDLAKQLEQIAAIHLKD